MTQSQADDSTAPATPEAAKPAEPEWWDDPGLPWRHKPTRRDWTCMAWIGFMGMFGLAMIPMRAWLLGLDPQWLLVLTGGRTGAVATGVMTRVGQAPWWALALVVGTIVSLKFDWVYWWAGRLWGRGIIEVWAGQSKRAAKQYQRAERWANKLGWVGMIVAYAPFPLPLMPVIFVLFGSSGMTIKKFLALDFAVAAGWLVLYFGLGYWIGEPAAEVIKAYAKYANYVAIGLLVVIIGGIFLKGNRKKAAA